MHQELLLPTVNVRHEYQLSVECHKQINVKNNCLSTMFKTKLCTRSTRSANTKQMEVPRTRTTTGSKAFSVRGSSHWNKLPNDTRLIVDHNEFEKSINKITNRDVDHPT